MDKEEHKSLGSSLYVAREICVRCSVDLPNRYGKRNVAYQKLAKAAELINEVRSQMDDKFFQEHPNTELQDGVYYGSGYDLNISVEKFLEKRLKLIE